MKVIEIFADGTQIERDLTEDEIEQREKDQAEEANRLKLKAEAIAKRAEAEAKLEALGLTTEDLKALGL